MAADLRVLQQRNGSRLYRFPRLPTEVRHLIWEYAFRTPHVHVFKEGQTSYSQASLVMQACKEAQEIGFKLRMPFYEVHRPGSWETPLSHFINFDLDTMWLDKIMEFPGFVEFYGGSSFEAEQVMLHPEGSKCPSRLRLNSLAMDIKIWQDPSVILGEDNDIGTTGILRMLNSPRELLVVVTKPTTVICPSNIIFVEPSRSPLQISNTVDLDFRQSLFTTDNHEPEAPSVTYTWDMAARRLENILVEFKEMREEERRMEMEEYGTTLEELRLYFENLEDLSNWEIPLVRYVEAIEVDRYWIRDLSNSEIPRARYVEAIEVDRHWIRPVQSQIEDSNASALGE